MITERAPAKVNLVLQVGPTRLDGLHEVGSLFASIDLEDQITVEPHDGPAHEVICEGVEGPNLCQVALEAYESASGTELPRLRVVIEKRIPIAAGMAGGSADAAAVLRAADRLAGSPLGPAGLRAMALQIGSDVPSQIEPASALVAGAGDRVEPINLPAMAFVLVPSPDGLATGQVFAEADRLGSPRRRLDLDVLRAVAAAPLPILAAAMENDLEPAALSLRPGLVATLEALESVGALGAQVTGSGPTCFGVFDGEAEAGRAAAELADSGMAQAVVARLRQN
ncbi:MAG: 4-diphosphocytidyl-2-C-methyl-D-erythritol kinase [Thermoleophilaceae bacterium]|nr:4-diphosphocytidyl-2-C-methyl-D-erythritol kinase [Thermoleophilaceae bacterium]